MQPLYKESWQKEDIAHIKYLEDEYTELNIRLEKHCFNPKMYKVLSEMIGILKKHISTEKERYVTEYSQAYIRPSD